MKLFYKITSMVKEEDKFLAEVYKIAGFALMTPFAQYFLTFSSFKISNITIFSATHFLISIVLFYFGYIMIQRAYEMVQEK